MSSTSSFDIITIGSALVDIFIQTDEFELRQEGEATYLCHAYGEKLEVEGFTGTTGGGGSNTAVGFARRGYATAVVTETGKDVWANFVMEDLSKEQVSTELIQVEKKEETGGAVILVGSDGGRTIMVHRGAASMLDPHDIPKPQLQQAKWIHLSSISGNLDTLQTIFDTIGKTGVGLSWNPGTSELELIAAGKINMAEVPGTIFMVNQEEWDQVASVQDQILQTFAQVVVTAGKKGGQVYRQGELAHQYTIDPVEAVEETGAGDAFIVGYVDAHLQGQTIEQACKAGKENAASVVQQVGAKAGLLKK
jgi:ribokinase